MYDGKPHNSLFQTRFGDEPCRAAQESHDFNRGRCQPTSEIAGNIEDEDVILGLREPQKLIEWAKTMKERAQCMAMAEFSAALQKHKAEGIDITKPMYTCLRSIEMDSNESYLLRYAAELLDNHPNPECGELFYDGDSWKCFPNGFQLKDIEAHAEDYIIIPGLFYDD